MSHHTGLASARTRRALVPAVAAALMLGAVPVLTMADAKSSSQELVSVKEVSASTLKGDVGFAVKGPSDFGIIKVTVRPGGSIPWHSHGGPVMVAVARGVATDYEPRGSECVRLRHRAGQAMFKPAGYVHTLRNEGRKDLVFYAVSLFPKGSESGKEEQQPANCPH